MSNKNTRLYADFNLNFKPHPLTGDIQMKYDEDAVKQSVYNLIMLNRYEKPFRPEISGEVRELLFEPMNQSTSIAIRSKIEFILKQFEPRIRLEDVLVEPYFEKQQYDITIKYKIINTLSSVEQKIFLQRVR